MDNENINDIVLLIKKVFFNYEFIKFITTAFIGASIALILREFAIVIKKKRSLNRDRKILKKVLNQILIELKTLSKHYDEAHKKITIEQNFSFKYYKYSFEQIEIFNFFCNRDLYQICKKNESLFIDLFKINSFIEAIKAKMPIVFYIEIEEIESENFNLLSEERDSSDLNKQGKDRINNVVKKNTKKIDLISKNIKAMSDTTKKTIENLEEIINKL